MFKFFIIVISLIWMVVGMSVGWELHKETLSYQSLAPAVSYVDGDVYTVYMLKNCLKEQKEGRP